MNTKPASPPQASHTWVALLSLVVAIAVLAVKFWAYVETGSQAVFGDALESIVNVVAAAFALGVLAYAGRPADRDHPFGHGKVEFFSAAFEGGLIFFAALLILWQAALTFWRGGELRDLDLGLWLTIAAGLANGALGWFLVRYGRQHRSIAIEADGHHVLSDFWTSAGVVVGLALVRFTGLVWIDPAVAALMGCWYHPLRMPSLFHNRSLVLGGIAVIAVVVACWFTSATPGLADPPVALHEDGDVPKASASESVERTVVEIDPLEPELVASVNASSGAICLTVCTPDGQPVHGVEVALFSPHDPEPAGVASAEGAGMIGDHPTESDAQGKCLFPLLEPGKPYRLAVNVDAPVFFEAQPSPFQELDKTGHASRVRLNKSFSMGSLAKANVSAVIPVTANTITKTRLLVASGGTIRGVVKGEWDQVTVNLNRLYRSVRSTLSSKCETTFSFDGIVPVGQLDVEFQARRGDDYYFGRCDRIALRDATAVELTLEPWDPSSSIELSLEADGASETEVVPSVWIKLLREVTPQIFTDLVLVQGRRIRVHGLFGARVISVQFFSRSEGWLEPRVEDIVGLRAGQLIGPSHAIYVRRKR
jgi:hypothetical protein